MKKHGLRIALFTSLVLFLFAITPIKAKANDTVTIPVAGRYDQTAARSIAGMINDFRTGDMVWYWNEDNQTKTVLTDLSELTYDYDLERSAMIRAAELAVNFSHTRPNGNSCFTSYTIERTTSGENIAMGHTSAEQVFVAWREDDCNYSGQGHRRNMLRGTINKVGIACFIYNGRKYWVQEFAGSNNYSGYVAPNDSTTTVDVEVAKENIVSSKPNAGSIVVYLDASLDISLLKEVIETSVWHNGQANESTFSFINNNLSVQDTSIARIQNGQLVGVSIGNTQLIMKSAVDGRSMSIPVEVGGYDINNAIYSSTYGYYNTYTGKPIKPTFTITYNGKVLTQGTDYTITYTNNIEPGTATATVTGIGLFVGSSRKIDYVIQTLNLNYASYSLSPYSYTYTGKEIKPSISITYDGRKLKPGTDYSVSYKNNIKPGTATITVTGLVSFKGSSFTTTFKILEDPNYGLKNVGTTIKDSKSKGSYVVLTSNKTNPTVKYAKCTDKNLTTIKIPDTIKYQGVTYKVTAVGAKALKGNKKVKTVKFGKNITKIGTEAFSGCTKLTTVSLNANLTTIGAKAFYGCSALQTLTLPAKTKTLGKQFAGNCKNFKTLTVKSTKMSTKTISDNAFSGIGKKATLKVPASKLKSYKKLFPKKGLSSKVKVKASK